MAFLGSPPESPSFQNMAFLILSEYRHLLQPQLWRRPWSPWLGVFGAGKEQLVALCLRSPHLTGPKEHARNLLSYFWVVLHVILIAISRSQPLH